jgi:hypothetical protein
MKEIPISGILFIILFFCVTYAPFPYGLLESLGYRKISEKSMGLNHL